jgi:signal peptidase II
MQRSPLKLSVFAIGFVGLVVIDQLVKLWVRGALSQGQSIPLWPNVFEIELTYNQGIAFGLFQGKGVFLTPVAMLISGGAAAYVWKHPEESIWNHVAFGLLAAGAVGNLIDRIVFHRVTDLFFIRAISFPVFNVADSCITIATVMLILGWWVEASRKKPADPETNPANAQ